MAFPLSGRIAASLVLAAVWATGATAQEQPRRTRVALGPQLVPRYPGADGHVVRPFLDFSRVSGDTPFPFEAADESSSISIVKANGFAFGPALSFEGSRRARDIPGLPRVGFTVELGGFAQYTASAVPIRGRVELRQGIGGHKGLIGMAGVDYIARERDEWLFSIGPRVTFSNGKYQRAYFGVPLDAVAGSGLPAFRPSGGIHAVGVNAGFLKQLSRNWGITTYAKYDRLIDDAGVSPVVRRFGDRNQLSGGVALSYTFFGRAN